MVGAFYAICCFIICFASLAFLTRAIPDVPGGAAWPSVLHHAEQQQSS